MMAWLRVAFPSGVENFHGIIWWFASRSAWLRELLQMHLAPIQTLCRTMKYRGVVIDLCPWLPPRGGFGRVAGISWPMDVLAAASWRGKSRLPVGHVRAPVSLEIPNSKDALGHFTSDQSSLKWSVRLLLLQPNPRSRHLTACAHYFPNKWRRHSQPLRRCSQWFSIASIRVSSLGTVVNHTIFVGCGALLRQSKPKRRCLCLHLPAPTPDEGKIGVGIQRCKLSATLFHYPDRTTYAMTCRTSRFITQAFTPCRGLRLAWHSNQVDQPDGRLLLPLITVPPVPTLVSMHSSAFKNLPLWSVFPPR